MAGNGLRRYIGTTSLRIQILALSGISAAITAVGAIVSMTWTGPQSAVDIGPWTFYHWRLTTGIVVASLIGLALMVLAMNRVVRSLQSLRDGMTRVMEGELQTHPAPAAATSDIARLQHTFEQMVDRLRAAQEENQSMYAALRSRNQTVDRLLEFSQTIQGAGKAEQIFSTLCQFVQTELSLSGVVLLGHEADTIPPTQVKAWRPEDALNGPPSECEIDSACCPCLRQHQPKHFRKEGSPVRCTIDAYLTHPQEQSAYCIPFTVGRKIQLALHMLLPEWEAWSEERRQLAQTYVNTAQSALTSLHLLAEAEQQSMTDALTGLYNRRSMEQLLEREVALADRHGRPLSLFMVDLDRFKPINDAHGHAAGDHLLKAFADCVRMTLRKTDLAFRYGGDEFAVALPQTSLAQAQQVVQKLRQAYAAVDFSSAITHLDAQPTMSIGIAERSAAQNVLSLQSLLSAADQALYEAKSANRNCVKTYQPRDAA
jgi:diguanylate cyclase (GGDEF)-like protein